MADDDIQGTVTDADGNAVENAVVALIPNDGSDGDDVLYAKTDANGNYLFDAHPQGDGTTQEWHVAVRYDDGSGNFNALSKPYVSASLPEDGAIPDSAVHHWPITTGTGSIITDDIGSNDGTLNGPSWASGTWEGDYALSFDGTDDYVEFDTLASAVTKTDPYSISLSFETSDASQTGILLAQSNSKDDRLTIHLQNGYVEAGVYNGNSYIATRRASINADTKYRVFYSYDGNENGRMWLNGAEETDTNAAMGVATNDQRFVLGTRTDLSQDPYSGGTDNVIVMDAEENGTTAQDDYDAQPWSDGGGGTTGYITHIADTNAYTQNSKARNLYTLGDTLYKVHNERLITFDTSDPTAPTELDAFVLDTADTSNHGLGIRVTSDGQYAFVGDGSYSETSNNDVLWVLDVSDPNNITEVTNISDSRLFGSHGLALGPNEDYLYVTAYRDDRFTVVDVSDPANPTITDSIQEVDSGDDSLHSFHDVAVPSAGDYAFCSSHASYFYSIDVSDPNNISIVDSIDYSNLWNGAGARLSADENYFFMGAGDSPGNLIAIDVSDPTNCVEVSRASDHRPYRLRIRDGIAYTSTRGPDSGMPSIGAWDVSDPTNVEFLERGVNDAFTDGYIDHELDPDEGYVYGAHGGNEYLSTFGIEENV